MWLPQKALNRDIFTHIVRAIRFSFLFKFIDNFLLINLIQNFKIIPKQLALLCRSGPCQLRPLSQNGTLPLELNSPFCLSILAFNKSLVNQQIFLHLLLLLSPIFPYLFLGLSEVLWYILCAVQGLCLILLDKTAVDANDWSQSSIWTQDCVGWLKTGIHGWTCIHFGRIYITATLVL